MVIFYKALSLKRNSTRLPSRTSPQWTKTFKNLTATIDSLRLCPSITFGLGASEVASWLSAATGIDFAPEKIMECGERV